MTSVGLSFLRECKSPEIFIMSFSPIRFVSNEMGGNQHEIFQFYYLLRNIAENIELLSELALPHRIGNQQKMMINKNGLYAIKGQ